MESCHLDDDDDDENDDVDGWYWVRIANCLLTYGKLSICYRSAILNIMHLHFHATLKLTIFFLVIFVQHFGTQGKVLKQLKCHLLNTVIMTQSTKPSGYSQRQEQNASQLPQMDR